MVDANPLLMEVVTVTRPASKATLQARLDALLREREFRQKRGCGYGVNVSDGWLERDIATLHEAINLTPADGVAGTARTYGNPISGASDLCGLAPGEGLE